MTYKPTTNTAPEPNTGEVWYFSDGIAATITSRNTARTDPTDRTTEFRFDGNEDVKPVRRVNI